MYKDIVLSIITGLFAVSTTLADHPQIQVEDLIVTEFMPSPTGYDYDREWFEVYNASPDAIDLQGLKVRGNGTQYFTVMGYNPVNPGQYFVFGVNSDPELNGGITVDYVYNYRHFSLSSRGDEISLLRGDNVIDEVYYDAGLEGRSCFLPNKTLDNSLTESWLFSKLPVNYYGNDNNIGTPGDFNEDVIDVEIVDAPIEAFRGDTVFLAVKVSNVTDHTTTFDGWISATKDGVTYIPFALFDNHLFDSVETTKTVGVRVPEFAPIGEYEVKINIGTFDTTNWSDLTLIDVR